MTWAETGDHVTRIAAGLIALGVQPEQRVAIASGTCYKWVLADLAIMSAGAATTTVYPATVSEDVAYILGDSDSHVVFAEDDVQIAKLRERRSELPALTKVVTFEGTTDGDWVISLDDLEKLGEELLAEDPGAVTDRIDATTPDSLATLIYTSGTTGRPKGVRVRHSSWTYEGVAVQATGLLSLDDYQFLWLPLAHSFGKVLLTAQLAIGFPTAVDGTVEKIIDNLAVVQADLHGRRAAHLREGARSHHHDGRGRRRCEEEDLRPRLQGRPRGLASGELAGRGGPGADGARAQALRQARLPQDPGAVRWPAALLRLRRCRAQPRDRRVVPCGWGARSSRATA